MSRLTLTRRTPATTSGAVRAPVAPGVCGCYAAPARTSRTILGALRACRVILWLGCAPGRRRVGGHGGGSPRREARASRAGARSPRPCAQLAAIDRPFDRRCRSIDRSVYRRLFAIDRRLIGRTLCRRRPSPLQEFPVVYGSALPPALCPIPWRLGERLNVVLSDDQTAIISVRLHLNGRLNDPKPLVQGGSDRSLDMVSASGVGHKIVAMKRWFRLLKAAEPRSFCV